MAQMVKSLPAVQEIRVPSLGRDDPTGEGNGSPLQDSCLENPVDGGAWQATVNGGHKESNTTERLTHTIFILLISNK